MQSELDRQRQRHLPLRPFQRIVNLHRIAVGIHLGVGSCKIPAGTVVVQDQVMNAADVGIFQHLALQLLDQLAVRALAEQRIDRVAHHLDAAENDQHRHRDTRVTVRREAGETRHRRRRQHHGGGQNIAQAVERRRLQHGGVDLFPQFAVEEEHPELHRNRQRDRQHPPVGNHRFNRVKNPLRRTLEEVDADRDDDYRDHQPGHIFEPAVAEGMFIVGRFGRHPEADQGHHRRAGVREVVHRVGQHRNAAGNQPDRHLRGEQRHIAGDTDHSAQFAVCLAHFQIAGILRFFHKHPDQKLGKHLFSPVIQ